MSDFSKISEFHYFVIFLIYHKLVKKHRNLATCDLMEDSGRNPLFSKNDFNFNFIHFIIDAVKLINTSVYEILLSKFTSCLHNRSYV